MWDEPKGIVLPDKGLTWYYLRDEFVFSVLNQILYVLIKTPLQGNFDNYPM